MTQPGCCSTRVHAVSTHGQHVLSPKTLPRTGWARGQATRRSLHRNASGQHGEHILIVLATQRNPLAINHITWICHCFCHIRWGFPEAIYSSSCICGHPNSALQRVVSALINPRTIQTSTVHSCGYWHDTYKSHTPSPLESHELSFNDKMKGTREKTRGKACSGEMAQMWSALEAWPHQYREQDSGFHQIALYAHEKILTHYLATNRISI